MRSCEKMKGYMQEEHYEKSGTAQSWLQGKCI